MSKKYDVFVSHSSKDKTTADAIVHYLEERKIRCWVAPRNIDPSVDWVASIIAGIKECNMFLLVFCTNSLKSDQVQRELVQAFKHKMPVLPFRIEDVMPEGTFSYYLDEIHWLDAFDGGAEKYFNELYISVVKIIGNSSEKKTNISSKVDEIEKAHNTNIGSNIFPASTSEIKSMNERNKEQHVDSLEKKLLYIDNMKGFFSSDYDIMRNEYVLLAKTFKDNNKVNHCKQQAAECRAKYNVLIKNEEPNKKFETKMDLIGLILLIIISVVYQVILWTTDFIRVVWESNNYFFPLIPLLIYSLLMGSVNLIFHKDLENHNGAFGFFFNLIVGLTQITALSIWFVEYDFYFVSFIGHLLFHIILSFFAVLPGVVLSVEPGYKKGDIKQTIIVNPRDFNKIMFDKMILRFKKVYKNNPEIMEVVYKNIANAYDFCGESDIAFEYYHLAETEKVKKSNVDTSYFP